MGVINECDRMSCILNGNHSFEICFYLTNDESFYYLSRKQLAEYWHCVTVDQKTFCPETCDDCDVCKELAEVFENLQNSYFFSLNEHGHEPVL